MGLFGARYRYVIVKANVKQDGNIALKIHCFLESTRYFLSSDGKMDIPFLTNVWNEAIALSPVLKQIGEVNILIGKINGSNVICNEMVVCAVTAENNVMSYGRVAKDTFQKTFGFAERQLKQFPNKKI